MTPFIMLCSYVSMFSLAMLVLLVFMFRFYRIQGKDNGFIGFLLLLFTALFLLGVILIGIFYRP